MQTEDTIFLDTAGLIPIQPPGSLPSSQRVHYWDEIVQSFLFEAFGTLFPKLEIPADGKAAYHHRHPKTDSFVASKPAESINDIPQGEAMKLLQGWIALRKLVMEETIPEGVRSLLMNLKIPDPRLTPWPYCVQDLSDGQKNLYILIGFEGPDLPMVSLEEGLAAMLNVPQSQLESLLSTSMAPTGDTKRVHVRDLDAIAQVNEKDTPQISEKRPLSRNVVALALVASAAVVVISIITLFGGKESAENNEKFSDQDSSAVTLPIHEASVKEATTAHERTEELDLEMVAKAKEIDPDPPREIKLDMVSHSKKNTQETSDDLIFEMTKDSKSEVNVENTEISSDAVDMIKQMSQ